MLSTRMTKGSTRFKGIRSIERKRDRQRAQPTRARRPTRRRARCAAASRPDPHPRTRPPSRYVSSAASVFMGCRVRRSIAGVGGVVMPTTGVGGLIAVKCPSQSTRLRA